jgi:hypothetical protein
MLPPATLARVVVGIPVALARARDCRISFVQEDERMRREKSQLLREDMGVGRSDFY